MSKIKRALFLLLGMFIAINILPSTEVHAKKKYYFNSYITGFNTDEACSSLSDIVMLTRIIHAEAGNQDYIGKQLVADVVLNRCDKFDQSVEEVIFAKNQFSTVCDGAYQRAAYEYTAGDFTAALEEYSAKQRVDSRVLFFTAGYYNPYCVPMYVHGDHYFGR